MVRADFGRWCKVRLLAAVVATGLAGLASADTSELHTFHCLYGCPVGAPATNDVVVRENYTMSTDDLTRMADWVAYRVTPEALAKSKGVRDWQRDPWLGADETLGEDDYAGASEALHVDRGHQAPLGAFSGTPTWAQTNILSNITPQSSALNQGPWRLLEAAEVAFVARTKTPLYVLTGPLFERLMRPMPAGPEVHRVPSGYWKILVAGDRMGVFIFDQATPRSARFCDTRAPLLEATLRARLRFFPEVDATKFRPLDEDVGCTQPAPARPAPSEIPSE